MASVAARIQERANILIAERQKLNDAKNRLVELEQERDREQRINDLRRRHLLEVTNARNEVELDIFKAKDEIQDLERSIVECEQEGRLCRERCNQAREDYAQKVETIYGPHTVEMELYERALKETVQAREEKLRLRLERLTAIRTQCKSIEAEEEGFRQEAKRLQEEAATLKSQATCSEKNDVITNLSKRIRETISEASTMTLKLYMRLYHILMGLSDKLLFVISSHFSIFRFKRANLRKKLKDARNESTKANAEYVKWEEMRINLTTGGS